MENPIDGRKFMSSMDVASYTGYSIKTIYRAVEAGTLKGVRRPGAQQYRFRLADVDRWITGQA